MRTNLKTWPGVLLLGVALAACGTGSTGTGSNESWMQRTYTGGRACSGGGNAQEARQEIQGNFRRGGLTPIKETYRERMVCKACSCPAYSFDHFIAIPRKQMGIARGMGYRAAPKPAVR